MRRYSKPPPWWVLSILQGVPFAAVMTLLRLDSGWGPALVGGGVAGLCFGLITGPMLARQMNRIHAAAAPLPPESVRAASNAAVLGPVPRDPLVREAAQRLAAQLLVQLQRHRGVKLVTTLAFTTLVAVLGATSSGWYWLALVLPVVMVAVQLWLPRHLRRRVELLGTAPGSDG